MPKYVIERTLPGAGKLSAAELKAIATKSNAVIKDLGPQIRWIETQVVDDKLYCLYDAPNAEIIAEHARRGGFPADRISPVTAVMSPRTAEV